MTPASAKKFQGPLTDIKLRKKGQEPSGVSNQGKKLKDHLVIPVKNNNLNDFQVTSAPKIKGH